MAGQSSQPALADLPRAAKIAGVTASGTATLTNKTIDGDDNTLSDIAVSSLKEGTDGELITWGANAEPTTVAAGTSGHVLVAKGAGAVPIFEAPDFELFAGPTAIGVATTFEVNNFVAGFDYIIQIEAFAPTDDAENLWMRWSDDGVPNYESDASDYMFTHVLSGSSAADAAASEIALTGVSGNDAGNYGSIIITLVNPMGTSENTTCYWIGFVMSDAATPVINTANGGAQFLQGTNNITDAQFLWSGGSTFKAQGDVTVWRRKRS